MKKYFSLLVCALLPFMFACSDDDDDKGYKTYSLEVALVYPEGIEALPDLTVKLTDGNNDYEAKTNAEGKAAYTVPAGIYEASVTDKRVENSITTIYNGTKSQIAVGDTGDDILYKAQIELKESKTSQLVIKELYTSGISYTDEGDSKPKTFVYDKYVILYNNSDEPASLDKVVLATTLPYPSTGTNRDYVGDKLFYENEGWTPAGQGVWYFTSSVILEPGKQILIALNQAIDHTPIYPGSVDLSKSEYYCTYDVEDYTHQTYVAPSANIPTEHHLKAYTYGAGTAWPLSANSPGFFIFSSKDRTLEDFVNDANESNLYNGSTMLVRKKVKNEWIIDAVEVFEKGAAKNAKRFTSAVDAGYVEMTKAAGYTVYRNVDVEATKAIEGNEAKLIMGYPDDPSGIDAEASIKNGARIIYKDTNNSSADFHERKKASIKE